MASIIVQVICLFVIQLVISDESADDWNGRWFPLSPNDYANAIADTSTQREVVVMGISDPNCDNAERNIELDWDFNPINYTCFEYKNMYRSRDEINPLYTIDFIPRTYSALHKCMDTPIFYNEVIPSFGPHRPLWAKYGEYKFLPKQRWLHNLEHGAITMLYHPCADKNEVNFLRKLVQNCLYRHIITPYNSLSPIRPLALVSWGHRLEMSKVDLEIAMNFITQHALRGPEHTFRDGQFDVGLEKHAEIVSEIDDRELCKLLTK